MSVKDEREPVAANRALEETRRILNEPCVRGHRPQNDVTDRAGEPGHVGWVARSTKARRQQREELGKGFRVLSFFFRGGGGMKLLHFNIFIGDNSILKIEDGT